VERRIAALKHHLSTISEAGMVLVHAASGVSESVGEVRRPPVMAIVPARCTGVGCFYRCDRASRPWSRFRTMKRGIASNSTVLSSVRPSAASIFFIQGRWLVVFRTTIV
jgi:hypothetical protein